WLVLLPLCREQGRHRIKAALEPIPRDRFEISGDVESLRHRELRQMQPGGIQLHLDPVGDPQGVLYRLWICRKDAPHLLRALDVEVVGVELHPPLVAEGLAGADAEKDLVSESVG